MLQLITETRIDIMLAGITLDTIRIGNIFVNPDTKELAMIVGIDSSNHKLVVSSGDYMLRYWNIKDYVEKVKDFDYDVCTVSYNTDCTLNYNNTLIKIETGSDLTINSNIYKLINRQATVASIDFYREGVKILLNVHDDAIENQIYQIVVSGSTLSETQRPVYGHAVYFMYTDITL